MKTIDLHCDLLCYLAEDLKNRKPTDDRSRCSLNQLQLGGVALQIFAIFAEKRKSSTKFARDQAVAYNKMLADYPDKIQQFKDIQNLSTSLLLGRDVADWPAVAKAKEGGNREGQITKSLIAIESAACLCTETDPLDALKTNLEFITEHCCKPLYLGITWNEQNRFGGGNEDPAGLSADGKRLLELLVEQAIALDLTHASDKLCEDALNWLAKNAPTHPILASHCVFRAVHNTPRNLHDDFAKEIIAKDGLIGLNFVKWFISGDDFSALNKHIQHGLKLGAKNNLCFGADFFYEPDAGKGFENPFFAGFDTAACYPKVKNSLKLNEELYQKLAFKNARSIIQQLRALRGEK